ncbi:MAG: thermonuclease family protein [Clostridia bacterium]|nr:thermonuclease family protein [Clostridia bacterium]
MKKLHQFLLLLVSFLCLTGFFPAQAEGTDVDWAVSIPLNTASETAKQQVTVKTFIDGDTVHFFVPESVIPGGVLKARFLAVNTPETTGKVEEYGKKAADFTRSRLENAHSIILESETDAWQKDTTGDRYLAWVWYQEAEGQPWRNLNIEILQMGLARPNSSANNRYGDICTKAIEQSKARKLNLYSGQKDPDFYYGDAIELTLKELRSNPEAYNGKKVAFNGVITMNSDNSVFLESYDAETDMYFGLSVYYGYNLNGKGMEILTVGNEARIVGTMQYYEAGETWQVSGLNYRMMKPRDPGNIQKLSDGHQPAYVLTAPETFLHGKVTLQGEETSQEFDWAQLAVATSVEMKGLFVESIHTTRDGNSSQNGAMTLSCKAGDHPIQVRTTVFYDENKALISEDAYLGKTIDVKGIVDSFEGTYQIKVFLPSHITVHP